MISNMILKMPRKESRHSSGINNANIETFKNTPMMSLTKEELQNSSDGKVESSEKPIIVEFNDFYISPLDIPDIDKMKKVYNDERAFWDDFLKKDKKAVKFFDKGIELLNKDKIRCLRISDTNTTGLLGVHEPYSSPWNNLVINTEVSDKEGSDGGSFGIGKDAAYANSMIRLVFYNTINLDGETAFEGVLKLPSYSKENDNYEGFGFFCKNTGDMEIDAIDSNVSLDNSYQRTEVGMDKYIIGFGEDLDSDALKKQIIVSSIDNFLYAFKKGKLIVKYGDVEVNQNNIDDIVELYKDDLNSRTIDYYNTLSTPDKIMKLSLMEEEDVTIYVKVDPDYCRTAAVVRGNGMKVFDMGHINGRIGFGAIIVLEKKKINEYFKKLENPEHSKWAIDRASNQAEAKRYQKEMRQPIIDAITEIHRESLGNEIDADGMSEFLPYTYTHGKKQKTEGLSNEVDSVKKAKKKKRIKKKQDEGVITYEEDENGNINENTISVNDNPEHEGGGGGHSPFEGEGRRIDDSGEDVSTFTEAQAGKFVSKRKIDNTNFKFKYKHQEGKHTLTILCKQKIERGYLDVCISGETAPIPVKVSNAVINGENAETFFNKVGISDVAENEVLKVSFDVQNEGDWALEVSVHES